PFVACSAVYYSLKALVAPDVPGNDGCYRPIAVTVPPGTILNPPPDLPVVGGNHETSQRAVDACFKALAHAIPERITAGGPTTSGLLLFSMRDQGRWRILYAVHGGADGAPYRITRERDGTRRDVKGKETVRLQPGDVVVIETCGGGGYGDPAARPPDLAARDRLDGYLGDAEEATG